MFSVLQSRQMPNFSPRVHRAVVYLKLAAMVFMFGSVITLSFRAMAQPKTVHEVILGERVVVAENQLATSKEEIAQLRTTVATMSGDLYTMRGMGIGAVTLLGVLDTVQLILLKRKAG